MKTSFKPNLLSGLFVFIAVLLIMILVASPIQQTLGIAGLAITEIILFLCGLLPPILFHLKLNQVFQMKRPSIRQIFGTLLLWCGSYISILLVSLILFYIFPEGMSNTNNSIIDVYNNTPYPLALFIVAVLPAICEEVLHRGFILYTFHKIKSKWIVIVSMGIIFGIFHLDPYRFLPTAILGITLTYIMIETKNILLPILFHFINNTVSVTSSFSVSNSDSVNQVTTVPFFVIGTYLVIASVVPILIINGSKFIHSKDDILDTHRTKRSKKSTILATVPTVLLLFSGIAISVISYPSLMTMNGETILNSSWSKSINIDTEMSTLPNIVINETDDYLFEFSAKGGNADSTVNAILKDSNEQIIFESGFGSEFSISSILSLKADTYMVEYHYSCALLEETDVHMATSIRRQ